MGASLFLNTFLHVLIFEQCKDITYSKINLKINTVLKSDNRKTLLKNHICKSYVRKGLDCQMSLSLISNFSLVFLKGFHFSNF